jgi:hypothetical protein
MLALAFAGTVQAQSIEDTTDRFTGLHSLVYTEKSHGPFRPLVSIKAGVGPNGLAAYMAQFAVVADGWRYLQCHDVHFLVDGERMETAPEERQGQVMQARYVTTLEILTVPLTAEQLQRLGAAQTVEFRICHDEYRFEPGTISAAAEISRRMATATP